MPSENRKLSPREKLTREFIFFTQHLGRVQLLKKYKNLIKKPLLDEAFLRPRTLFYHPLFMLLVCNNVTRKTKCYKKNTVLLNSQKGLLLFINCDKIV